MKSLLPYLLSASILVSSSCETDFDVTADWKDVTVVYGLLNQNDSVHYVRINRAYLGDGDALQMATEFDSIHYGNNIEAYLQELNQWNVPVATFVFEADSTIPKDVGIFSNPFQVVYKTSATLNPLNTYKLIIRNTETGKDITAVTPLVDDFTIVKPGSSVNEKINWTAQVPYKPKWFTGENGKLYQLTIRFNFREVNKVDPSDVTYRSLDWVHPAIEVLNTDGGNSEAMDIAGDNFYMWVASQLEADFDIYRLADNLDFIVNVAGEEFNTYMEVNRPSTGIVQEKPEYTNLENAIGLFSCRYQEVQSGKEMTLTSLDSLRAGRFTGDLGFQ